MHIAAAVGTRVIAIHGPTDPTMSGPVSPLATVLRSDIWCSPCYTAKGGPADCRFFTTQCMKDITPEQVLGKFVVKRGGKGNECDVGAGLALPSDVGAGLALPSVAPTCLP